LKVRSRTEIIGLILQAVEGEPLTRSKIMYQSMLNFKQVNDYTSLLIQQELLSYSKLDRTYILSLTKARQFLALFTESSKLLTATTTTPEDDGNMAGDNNLLQVQNQQLPPQQHREMTVHK
jgi:predicted transcriptional regulator